MPNQKKAAPVKESSSMNLIIGIIVAVLVVVVAVTVFLVVQLVGDKPDNTGAADMTAIKAEINSMKVTDFTETDKIGEYVKITVKGHGDIIVRLRADIAPITVKNFQNLVAKDFYDGLTIHRVSKNFVIQGGNPKGNGTGSSDPIKGEFSTNGVRNELQHLKGVISMARRGDSNDSGSCQFFICLADARSSLDGKYAGFGYVVAGLEVVDSIAAVSVNGETPVDKIVIEKICFVNKK